MANKDIGDKVKKFDMSDHSRIEEFIENVALELGGLDI